MVPFRPRWHHLGGMRDGITVEVSAADRGRLRAIVADRNSPRKHAWRPAMVRAPAEGCGPAGIMRRAGVSKPCVWRWQAGFMAVGVGGLLRDKTRPPGTPPLPAATVERVVELTLGEPPGEATHWTGQAMAKAAGIGLGGPVRNFVCGPWIEHSAPQAAWKRSSNRIANWALAMAHSLGGILHHFSARFKTRKRSFKALSSLGKWPRVRSARRSLAFRASIAFVV